MIGDNVATIEIPKKWTGCIKTRRFDESCCPHKRAHILIERKGTTPKDVRWGLLFKELLVGLVEVAFDDEVNGKS
jgi:hypothetical protein